MVENSGIIDKLGGSRMLGRRVSSALDLSDLIEQGLPAGAAFHLQKSMHLNDTEYSAALGLSPRTLSRFRENPPDHLKLDVSDRVYRLARIYRLAEEVLENSDAALEWLHRPQLGLDNRTPLELLRTEAGSKEVEELLYRIEYGLYS